EIQVETWCGGVRVLLELHTQLDKIVCRPIEYAEIFSRARPAPGYPGLLVPSPEDHFLLVGLHAAGTEFNHLVAFHDLALLLRSGVNDTAVIDRAKRWRLGTAMFVALSALRGRAGVDISDAVLRALAPSWARLAAIRRVYRLGEIPVGENDF